MVSRSNKAREEIPDLVETSSRLVGGVAGLDLVADSAYFLRGIEA